MISSIGCLRASEGVLCLQAAQKIEDEYHIPEHILTAIALTETGQKKLLGAQKIFMPWPWTINVAGQGSFFNTKSEAIAAVKKAQARGIKSIDVGCMQINLKYHNGAFDSLEEAFDPELNVRYAAEFLTSLHEHKQDWNQAIGKYHSGTSRYAKPYRQKVLRHRTMAQKIFSEHSSLLASYMPKIPRINENTQGLDFDTRKALLKKHYRLSRLRKIALIRAKIRAQTM